MADDEFDDDELPTVASSENDIIMIARALTAPHQYDVWGLIAGARVMPPKIGPTAAGLIGDAFAQIWPALWKRDEAAPTEGHRGRLGVGERPAFIGGTESPRMFGIASLRTVASDAIATGPPSPAPWWPSGARAGRLGARWPWWCWISGGESALTGVWAFPPAAGM